MKRAATATSLPWLVVAGWAAVVIVLNLLGVFATDPERLPLPLLVAVVAPPILFGLGWRASATVRAAALGLDLQLLTALQAWRVIGGMFLVLLALGVVPGSLAWPAGVGDLIVGVWAPFVLLAMVRAAAGWERQVLWLNVFGLVDLLVAVVAGVLSGRSPIGLLRSDVAPDVMLQLPLSLLPSFGVPFWIVLHIVSLLQVRRLRPQVAIGRMAHATAAPPSGRR